jgi:hypothetical protein
LRPRLPPLVLPILREREIDEGRVVRRCSDHAGNHRGLRCGDLIDTLAEVGVRRSVDAVGARTKVHDVEVALEYFILGVVSLDLDGKKRFLNFA